MSLALATKNEVFRSYTVRARGGDVHSFLDSVRCQDALKGLPETNSKVIRSRKRLDYHLVIRWSAKGTDEFNQLSFRVESPAFGVKGFTALSKELCEEHFPEMLPYMHLHTMTAVGPLYMFDGAIYHAQQGNVAEARKQTCLRAKPDSFFTGNAGTLAAQFCAELPPLMLELEQALMKLGFNY